LKPHEVTGDLRDMPPPYDDQSDLGSWPDILKDEHVWLTAGHHETWDYDHPVRRSHVSMVQIWPNCPSTTLAIVYHDHLDDPHMDYQPPREEHDG
jgi:hypothetical protein